MHSGQSAVESSDRKGQTFDISATRRLPLLREVPPKVDPGTPRDYQSCQSSGLKRLLPTEK
eukprot:IDg20674t1